MEVHIRLRSVNLSGERAGMGLLIVKVDGGQGSGFVDLYHCAAPTLEDEQPTKVWLGACLGRQLIGALRAFGIYDDPPPVA